jgi:hypothetical protein
MSWPLSQIQGLLIRKRKTYKMIPLGALAQLVERNNGIVEVNGSTPLRSSY